MCGISGWWQSTPLDAKANERLDAMLETLHHRGPDGRGQHLDPARGLAMGHTRLSIIDLNTGDQPLFDTRGDNVLTANGEFYAYKRIRAQLVCDGERFATKADSEIALPLYRRHGLDFVEHLRGEFAFALFDAQAERLILVRDRFGIKPLYLHASDALCVWGSELKSILAHPAIEARLDPRATLHQMMQTMAPGSTAFAGIEALLPGHFAIIERREGKLHCRTHRYWDADFPREGEHSDADDPSQIARVRDGLLEAVQLRLEADVPVGCYLSGGIDSCSILGLASAVQQSEVKAYTIAFDHADYDESHIAAEMAAATGADQVKITLGAKELYGRSFERTMWHTERTFYNTLGVAKWHMSRTVRDSGYKVVVTGEGSDELFGGYPFFKRDLYLHASDDSLREKHLEALRRSNAVFEGSILSADTSAHPSFDARLGFTPSWIQPWIQTLAFTRPLLSAALREELADYDPIAAIAESLDPAMLEGRHALDRVQYSWIKTMLEGQILTWGGDRVDMANSMESRPAFLDHHLAEAAFRIPPALRIRDNREKWVLREAMRGVLPKVLYEREKFAFMAPPSHTDLDKRREIEQLAARHLSPTAIDEAGLFDPAAIVTLLEQWRQSEGPVGTRLDIVMNHLLGLQLLHHQFVAGHGRPSLEA